MSHLLHRLCNFINPVWTGDYWEQSHQTVWWVKLWALGKRHLKPQTWRMLHGNGTPVAGQIPHYKGYPVIHRNEPKIFLLSDIFTIKNHVTPKEPYSCLGVSWVQIQLELKSNKVCHIQLCVPCFLFSVNIKVIKGVYASGNDQVSPLLKYLNLHFSSCMNKKIILDEGSLSDGNWQCLNPIVFIIAAAHDEFSLKKARSLYCWLLINCCLNNAINSI